MFNQKSDIQPNIKYQNPRVIKIKLAYKNTPTVKITTQIKYHSFQPSIYPLLRDHPCPSPSPFNPFNLNTYPAKGWRFFWHNLWIRYVSYKNDIVEISF